MRKVTKTGSIRTLTAKRLMVDWEGFGTIIYWMTKIQMQKVLAKAKKITIQGTYCGKRTNKECLTFLVKHRTTGGFSIGCESFTKNEVKELRQWSKK